MIIALGADSNFPARFLKIKHYVIELLHWGNKGLGLKAAI